MEVGIHQKYIKQVYKKHNQKGCKNEAPKSSGPEGARGHRVLGGGKGVPPETPGQGSLLHPTSSKKQASGKQLKSSAPEPLTINSHALGVLAGTVRIYKSNLPAARFRSGPIGTVGCEGQGACFFFRMLC